MRRNEIIAKLKSTEPELRQFGIAALYLFGSHARDQAGPDSDIDVFVDFTPGSGVGFLPYMDAFDALRTRTGGKVDYGTRSGLHPLLREEIEREAIRIF